MIEELGHGDPLLRDIRCNQRVVLPVLGLPTSFESNSTALLELIEEAFGGWRAVERLATTASDPLSVRIVVFEDSEHGPRPPAIRHYAPDATRIILQSPGSIAVSDPGRREVVGYVTTGLLAERELFRTAFLEAATLALLSHFDRHPIHAAAIARNGRAVLLAGASGAGKSTLAHLADSAGDDVLGEDHVWIQLEASRRVWGWPGYARLLKGECEPDEQIPRSGRDDKRISPLRGRDRISCYVAEAPTVCVLDRGPRAALQRVDAPTILDALTRDVTPGFDRFPERNIAVANALSAGGGWRLTLTTNPNDVLPLLDEMLNAS
jgi:hypothetical protein